MASICRNGATPVRRVIYRAGHVLGAGGQWQCSAMVPVKGSSAVSAAGVAAARQAAAFARAPTDRRRFGTFRPSAPRLEEHVMNLPSMGDSISEGTVVEWCKAVGDSVEEDEIIAVVETDKVSVDIRSTHVGVVVKLFAAVDDVVEVGKPLCTIEGDEAAALRAREEAEAVEEYTKAPPAKIKKPKLLDAATGAFIAGADFVAPKKKRHEPLIKFLGKRSLLRQKQERVEAGQESTAARRHRHSPGALDMSQIVGGASFGRPPMSDEEMEAINSGGAESAPKLRYIDGSRWA